MRSKLLEELDINFCDDSQKNKAESWKHTFSKDGVVVTSKHLDDIIGSEDIYKALEKTYQDESLVFVWKPRFSDISDDLTLGFTSGIYTKTSIVNNEEIIVKGKHLTVWKKFVGGYQIIFDIGN